MIVALDRIVVLGLADMPIVTSALAVFVVSVV